MKHAEKAFTFHGNSETYAEAETVDPFIQLFIEYGILEFPEPVHEINGFELIDKLEPHTLHFALNGLAMMVSDHFGEPEEARNPTGLTLSWVGPTGSRLVVKTQALSPGSIETSLVAVTIELAPPWSH